MKEVHPTPAESAKKPPRLRTGLIFGAKFLPLAALLLFLYSGHGLSLYEPYLELQARLARPILLAFDLPPHELIGRQEARLRRIRSADEERILAMGKARYEAMAVSRKDLGLPLITYAALILATAGIAWRRRLRLLAIGLAILVLTHVPTLAVLFLEYLSRLQGVTGRANIFGNLADVLNILSEILPFILWFLLVPIRLPAFLPLGGPPADDDGTEEPRDGTALPEAPR